MNKIKTLSILAFATILSMVAFQNCAKVAVAEADLASGKVVGTGDPLDSDLPPVADIPTETPSEPPAPAPVPPVADQEEPKKTCDGKDRDSGGGGLDDISESEAIALCATGKGKHFLKRGALAGPEIVKIRGGALVESDLLNRVEDIRGAMLIKGKTSAATAKTIRNTRGAMVICGMAVDEIDDSRGAILLVNSEVKSIHNHRGAILLVNSEIGNTSDIRGAIKEINK